MDSSEETYGSSGNLQWCAMIVAILLLANLIPNSRAAFLPQDSEVSRLIAGVRNNPGDADALQALHDFVCSREHYSAERMRTVQPLFEQYTKSWQVVIPPPDEPGQRIRVRGVVQNPDGGPIAHALIHVFQTDARGFYTPQDAMNEPQARLFGYVRSNEAGEYRFDTIRPGGYPWKRKDTSDEMRVYIPEHIHFEVSADGHRSRSFQMVFDDDARMNPFWRNEWAPEGGHPIVKMQAQNGLQQCSLTIILTPQ